MTLKDSTNATSSLELAVGHSRSKWPDGQKISPCGQGHALASHLAQQESERGLKTNGTCGQNSCDSLTSVDLQRSLASKSPVQREENGSLVMRKCSECGIDKPLSEFYKAKSSRQGYRAKCKPCCRLEEKKRKDAVPAAVKSEKFRNYRKTERAKVLLNVAKYRAKKKGLSSNISVEEVQLMLSRGHCELTGIPFNLDGGKTWDSPSLDRVDNSKGYDSGNVRVTLYCVNVMANVWGPSKILEIAAAIRAERSSRSASLQAALEARLKERLTSEHHSPLYVLTWKHWGMQSGPPICALRASARRTSVKGFSGWPTATVGDAKGACNATASRSNPESRHHAGTTLVDAAKIAGWPTPKSQRPDQSTTYQGGNPTLAKAAEMATGMMSSTSTAETRNVGQLNPDFTRWLMGYPDEWLSCVDWEMLSSRKLPRRS